MDGRGRWWGRGETEVWVVGTYVSVDVRTYVPAYIHTYVHVQPSCDTATCRSLYMYSVSLLYSYVLYMHTYNTYVLQLMWYKDYTVFALKIRHALCTKKFVI